MKTVFEVLDYESLCNCAGDRADTRKRRSKTARKPTSKKSIANVVMGVELVSRGRVVGVVGHADGVGCNTALEDLHAL